MVRRAVFCAVSCAVFCAAFFAEAASPIRPCGMVRTCVGCRKRAPASELLRFTAVGVGADCRLRPDPGRRLPGRGAHVHPDPACFALAERRRAFGRSLRLTGVPDTGALAEHVRAVSVPHGATDGGAWEPHPDSQGRTTDMSTR